MQRIAIVGAGALGSLFGALLALAGEAREKEEGGGPQIWLVGSPSSEPHLAAITAAGGLRLELAPGVATAPSTQAINETRIIPGIRVTFDPAEVYPADLALILVKSYRSPEAAQQVKMLLAPKGIALTLQNGLGNFEVLASAVGLERAAQGVTSLGASLSAPGTVRWNGRGPVSLGLTPQLDGSRQQVLLDFLALLSTFNIEVKTTNNIQGLVWGKLVINCAINALGALLNVPNGELVKRPSTLEVLNAAATEAAEVARVLGIELPYPYEEAALQARLVAERTATNFNSMLVDVQRGRPTEIEAINAAVAREGQRLGVLTLVNWTLAQLVKSLSPMLPSLPLDRSSI